MGGFQPNYAVNEDIKTYWSAKSGAKGEYIISDLGEKSTINAIQINYADQDVELMGKPETTTGHKYVLYYSDNNKDWKILLDKSKNTKDVPHDYIELEKSIRARYVKMVNIQMPQVNLLCAGIEFLEKEAELLRELSIILFLYEQNQRKKEKDATFGSNGSKNLRLMDM